MSERLYKRVKIEGQGEFKGIGPLSVQSDSSLKTLLHFHFKHHFIDISDILEERSEKNPKDLFNPLENIFLVFCQSAERHFMETCVCGNTYIIINLY